MDTQPSHPPPTLAAAIASLFLETLFFGAFAILYGAAVWVLLIWERPQERPKRDLVLFGASTLMFVLALVHVALDLTINVRTFLMDTHDFSAMESQLDKLNGLEDPIGAVKSVIYVTQTLIGDGFMIYRAYVVWDRSWRVVALPGCILFADVVLGYVTSFLGKDAPAGCINAFFVWSFVTNMMSSALIIKRIFGSRGNTAQGQQSSALQIKSVKWRVVESLVQSAAIYSIGSVSLAVTSFVSPNVGFTACHSVFPSIIGLVFVLIVIRISFNSGNSADVQRWTMRHSMAQGPSCTSLQEAGQTSEMQRFPSVRRPIAIKVSVSTTSDRESVYSSDGDGMSLSASTYLQSPMKDTSEAGQLQSDLGYSPAFRLSGASKRTSV
ncbi:hypothetical protein GY45DRAFT_1375253 [Cubamyces sp. BRFM 1775]|nr:hypothetical protein GY45DRAFT_1375253 [Cubamyces sp. BRFM 1775]